MDLSSLLALPSTLALERVERSAEGLTVYLHATTSCVSCPRCGTVGSRVHICQQCTSVVEASLSMGTEILRFAQDDMTSRMT